MKVAIQGIKGAFHEEAANRYFNTNQLDIEANLSFSSLVQSVESGSSDRGIIAIENTISGTIHQNLGLVKESNTEICGEVFIRIRQNLVALQGTEIAQIHEVQSHYMALNQCRNFLSQYPHLKISEAEDTALIMRNIAQTRQKGIAAIGSSLAATYYGLEIIAPDIETNKKNYTRFWIIRKKSDKMTQPVNKASICFVLHNQPGSLAKILSLIALFQIDLTKIESQPIVGQPWNYMFYVDVIFADIHNYHQMIDSLQKTCVSLNILGEYEENIQTFNQIHN